MQAMKAGLLEMTKSGEDQEVGPQNVLHNIPNPAESIPPTWKKALLDLFTRIKVIPKTRVLMKIFPEMCGRRTVSPRNPPKCRYMIFIRMKKFFIQKPTVGNGLHKTLLCLKTQPSDQNGEIPSKIC